MVYKERDGVDQTFLLLKISVSGSNGVCGGSDGAGKGHRWLVQVRSAEKSGTIPGKVKRSIQRRGQ